MMIKKNFFKNLFIKYQEQILYLISGVATTCVNWIVYTISLMFFSLSVSNSIAWVFAVIFAFLVNKVYVFRSKETNITKALKEFFLFLGARVFSGIFEIVGLPLLVYMGLNQRIFNIEGAAAKILISIIVIISNYLFSKFIVFKNKKLKGKI